MARFRCSFESLSLEFGKGMGLFLKNFRIPFGFLIREFLKFGVGKAFELSWIRNHLIRTRLSPAQLILWGWTRFSVLKGAISLGLTYNSTWNSLRGHF